MFVIGQNVLLLTKPNNLAFNISMIENQQKNVINTMDIKGLAV
jgi:hypothetical protein